MLNSVNINVICVHFPPISPLEILSDFRNAPNRLRGRPPVARRFRSGRRGGCSFGPTKKLQGPFRTDSANRIRLCIDSAAPESSGDHLREHLPGSRKSPSEAVTCNHRKVESCLQNHRKWGAATFPREDTVERTGSRQPEHATVNCFIGVSSGTDLDGPQTHCDKME